MKSRLISPDKVKTIEKILSDHLCTKGTFSIETLKGGGNNRVFLVKYLKHRYVLKSYFQSSFNDFSRIEKEYQFLQYAWKIGIRNIPKPIMIFKEDCLAIYSYIDGIAPTQNNIKISPAIDFLLKLNANKTDLKSLMPATEGCFCYQDYLDTVDKKLSTLNICAKCSKNTALEKFLQSKFFPKWDKVKRNFIKKHPTNLNVKFPLDQLFITPSDFGFHNVLLKVEKVYFIDFEYAGYDDIAKTICDFFCQPKYPISMRYLTSFTSALLRLVDNPILLVWRIQDIMPICQMKWCCIILNIFLKDGKKRREFSLSDQSEYAQLNQAAKYLNKIKEDFLWPI